jgi:hypothetical protein
MSENFFTQVGQKVSLPTTIMAQQQGLTVPQFVLMQKLQKHTPRKQALYLALFLAWSMEPLPQQAKDIAHSSGLKLAADCSRVSVGYPHEDGTYHWFIEQKVA